MPQNYKLAPKITISHRDTDIYCVQYSPDGNFLTAGCGDGSIRIYNALTGREVNKLVDPNSIGCPVTCIRFRPQSDDTSNNSNHKSRNVFIAANTAGLVQHWHLSSGKCIFSQSDSDNHVYCINYDNDGNKFITAGKDTNVRIYDEATKSLISTMTAGSGELAKTHGHMNRIFSCKFVPHDNHLIMSGGWDSTIQIWDTRIGEAVRSIYGPHICGVDAMDIVGSNVLAASWRIKNTLEIYDFSKGTKVTDIKFNEDGQKPCMLYAGQYSKEGQGKFICAGGSSSNEAKIFDHHNDNELIGTLTGLSGGVFSIDWCPQEVVGGVQHVAVAGGDLAIRILEVFPNTPEFTY
eukprot:TRINITY_DN18475_c0_g1_i1.p1 TRINITY_DN18475_c0_g1~~TRINITY_DN18475_c0_g1_i1.p1  ORF type:complete len:349 (-),score=-27.60 TRINITY_DN18475_c0_g1_i1:81-1127(-)